MPVNLPTNILRSFVSIVDTGSMLQASEQVFLTQSALSLQIKRLEELVQQSLFHREGRRLVLTQPGAVLLDYARRVLNLHDEAVAAVTAGKFAGPARVGMVQDFAETMLTGLLAQFAELHPEAEILARVAGTAELQELLARRELDVIVGFAAANAADALAVTPMAWFGATDLLEREVLPLAVLESPCRFREAAMHALEEAGVRYRIAVETPNLSTLRAAVHAGLGVTCRTHLFLSDLAEAEDPRLPPLPKVACIVQSGELLDDACTRLATLTRALVAER
ncbi:LysR substrate-binding domain-containing protein [Sphingomonas sp. TDK1]|uniref:LysR substrate-binding domain-containing protein n=1 Tax=Sphingomonas sp. TDK1 TaxID=453247 RepID=UPI0007DA1485|nr:LysR substrate-binding domain-containing protein [Sphingomonas sp. TDK1]OAN66769.1 LysR family transcriptional regulator [Sphingomonas sp. TDK1]